MVYGYILTPMVFVAGSTHVSGLTFNLYLGLSHTSILVGVSVGNPLPNRLLKKLQLPCLRPFVGFIRHTSDSSVVILTEAVTSRTSKTIIPEASLSLSLSLTLSNNQAPELPCPKPATVFSHPFLFCQNPIAKVFPWGQLLCHFISPI